MLSSLLISAVAAARETPEEACEAGKALWCHRLGYAASTGEGRDYDPELALKLLQRACDLGERDACNDRAAFVLKLRAQLSSGRDGGAPAELDVPVGVRSEELAPPPLVTLPPAEPVTAPEPPPVEAEPTPEPEPAKRAPAPPLYRRCISDGAYARSKRVEDTKDDPLAFKPSAVWLPPFFLSDAARSYTWAGLLYFNSIDFKAGEQTTVVPPFFVSLCTPESETVVTPLYGSREDAEGTARLFLTYFQRRDRLAQTDIFFPLVWSLREREAEDEPWTGWGSVFPFAWWGSNSDGSRWAMAPPLVEHWEDSTSGTTVVGNFYWHHDRELYDVGLVPLYFGGRTETGGYEVSPLLFWHFRDGAEHSLLLLPLLTYHSGDADREETWVANTHVRLSKNGWGFDFAPLFFSGVEGEARHAYAPPLFFWSSEGDTSTTVVASFYWHHRDDVTAAGLVPLYFAARWPTGGFDVQPLLFWSYREGAWHSLVMPPLLTYHRGDGVTEETWTANVHVKTARDTFGLDVFPLLFSYVDGREHHVFAPPLFWRWGEGEESTTIFGSFYWHQNATDFDLGVVPLYFGGRALTGDYDISPLLFWSFREPGRHSLFLPPLLTYHRGSQDTEETWVGPAYYGERPAGWTFNVFPLVFSGRDEEQHHEVVAPVFFRWGDAKETTTIFTAGYLREEPERADFGFAPLYFGGRSTTLDYDVSPALFWSFRDGPSSGLAVPALALFHGSDGVADTTVLANSYWRSSPDRFDLGIAPLYFGGRGRSLDYDVSPPLFWSFRDAEHSALVVPALGLVHHADAEATTTVLLSSFWRTTPRRYDLGVAPLYFRGRGEGIDYDVSPALFWSIRDGVQSSLFLPPLLAYFQSRPTGFSLVQFPLFFAAREGDEEHDVAPPLWWHFKSAHQDTTVAGAFYRVADDDGQNLGLLPLFHYRETHDSKLFVSPLAVHASTPERSTTVAGGLYWDLEGPDLHARVVAPLWWDFKTKASGKRLSTFFPVYWRYEKPEEVTHVFLNVMVSSGTTELGPSWSFHLFPLLDLVSYHPKHFLWQVLTGLVGHERQGDSERWRVGWFWTDPSEPAPAPAPALEPMPVLK